MKKLLLVIALVLLPLSASAAVTFPVNGGSGNAGTLTGWLYGNSTSPYTASTTPYFSTFFSAGLGSCFSGNSALTWSAGLFGCHTISSGGGSGTVGTSTVPTIGQLAYWTSNGSPSLLGSTATGTVSAGTGISVSAGQSVIGSGLVITNTGVTSVATDSTLTGGTITTTGTLGLNLSNANTWIGGQTFTNATATTLAITKPAVAGCSGSNALQTASNGNVVCGPVSGGAAGISIILTDATSTSLTSYATTTKMTIGQKLMIWSHGIVIGNNSLGLYVKPVGSATSTALDKTQEQGVGDENTDVSLQGIYTAAGTANVEIYVGDLTANKSYSTAYCANYVIKGGCAIMYQLLSQ